MVSQGGIKSVSNGCPLKPGGYAHTEMYHPANDPFLDGTEALIGNRAPEKQWR